MRKRVAKNVQHPSCGVKIIYKGFGHLVVAYFFTCLRCCGHTKMFHNRGWSELTLASEKFIKSNSNSKIFKI